MITYQFPNPNGAAMEVWQWICIFIPHFIMDEITCIYPCRGNSYSMLVKGAPRVNVFFIHHVMVSNINQYVCNNHLDLQLGPSNSSRVRTMFINSTYIVDQDAHRGATFDSIWYLLTCHIIPDIGWRQNNLMMFGSSSSISTLKHLFWFEVFISDTKFWMAMKWYRKLEVA